MNFLYFGKGTWEKYEGLSKNLDFVLFLTDSSCQFLQCTALAQIQVFCLWLLLLWSSAQH